MVLNMFCFVRERVFGFTVASRMPFALLRFVRHWIRDARTRVALPLESDAATAPRIQSRNGHDKIGDIAH